ncbi:Mu transposase C-terminal domain-containing protein [Roseicella aquatilis]|nr:Mu transposase C-terminal domain-containing protein [Roseicella aquatilis]
MERLLLPGTAVEHAGRAWRVERALGADAVLLRDEAGEVLVADPATLCFPEPMATPNTCRDQAQISPTAWSEACRRRDVLLVLAAQPARTLAQVDAAAAALGLHRRQTFALLRRLRTHGSAPAVFLPGHGGPRAGRLGAAVEAIVTGAIEQHYARPTRPSLLSLSREVDARCAAAGLAPPSAKAVAARVRRCDRAWLAGRREGGARRRALRLLTGAHPAAEAPWACVQIDSTPSDVQLVREADRAVIGRATATFALDLYSRAILGLSVSLDAPSTVTVASCLEQACLPKDDWLARRGLAHLCWPCWGRPQVLEYDRGAENTAAGIARGLQRYGIEARVRPPGRPDLHGHVERLIGTMMQRLHERLGSTFGSVAQRGKARPEETACLTVGELERVLALVVEAYNGTVHEATGERPVERYLAWYRQPGLADAERVPPRMDPARFLLDFLPFERRALGRGGLRLFRIDYSAASLLPLWRRDNGRRVMRVVVYDPRSLARVWVLDEATGEYIGVPYRTPRPDMTLAESEAARARLRSLRAADRTEPRLFESVAEIRRIEAKAATATARRRAERAREGRQAATEARTRCGDEAPPPAAPAFPVGEVEPFSEVEVT